MGAVSSLLGALLTARPSSIVTSSGQQGRLYPSCWNPPGIFKVPPLPGGQAPGSGMVGPVQHQGRVGSLARCCRDCHDAGEDSSRRTLVPVRAHLAYLRQLCL